jgi:hypothetical protein
MRRPDRERLAHRQPDDAADRGLLRARIEVLNQRRQVVMGMKAINLVLCRGPAASRRTDPPQTRL